MTAALSETSWRTLLDVAVAGCLAAFVTHLLLPPVARLARLVQAVDRPGGRRAHIGVQPRLGGLAMVTGATFGFAAALALRWDMWQLTLKLQDLVTLGLAASLIALVGLVDDVTGVSALNKLAVQLLAAGVLVIGGWEFTLLGTPAGGQIELGWWGGVITIVWIVAVVNAVNLLDGLDGLAAGVVAIIGGSFIIYAVALGNVFAACLLGGVVGACVGFLPHNWAPAKLFMGDSGSLTFGFLLAAASVHTSLKAPTAVAILVPMLALGVPLIDTALVAMTRFLERPKGSFFERSLRVLRADRAHLHHLMQSILVERRDVVRGIYLLVFASSALALAVASFRRVDVGLAVLVVELAAVGLIRRLGFARRVKRMTREQRQAFGARAITDSGRAADEAPASTGTDGV